MFKKIIALLLVAVLSMALFAGCEKTVKKTEKEEAVTVRYKVTFAMKGNILSEQQVARGQFPAAVPTEVEGLIFQNWLDESGAVVDPFTVAVNGEMRYEAQAYPNLQKHAPFLFVNEAGQLCPGDLLTADDLYNALHALAEPGAQRYFPGLYTGKAAVTTAELTKVLSHFFPSEQVTATFTGEVTRESFACGMLSLLGRSWEEKQTTAEDAVLPVDVHSGSANAAQLLESCMPHTPDENGTLWTDLELPTPYEPGFVNIDGWLYYVQQDGYFLKDGDVGELHFGADGRFTSGDAELDATVAGLLKQFMEENPDKDRFEILRVAFDHCVNEYKYLRKGPYPKGATGWELEDAKEMFSSGKGNCYNFAAIFWALARGLGYEAYAISGNCTGTVQPHGWVQIEIDGADYFFDPEWQYAYHERGDFEKDMFMLSMDEVWWWTYDWYPI